MITPTIFGAIALLIGAFLLIGRPTYFAATVYALLILFTVGVGITALGNPAPLAVSGYRLKEPVTVAGYVLDEGKAIYLLIAGDPPQLIQLPWSEQQAAQLHEAGEAAKKSHTALKANLAQGKKGSGTQSTQDDEKPLFYPAPRDSLPPKQGE